MGLYERLARAITRDARLVTLKSDVDKALGHTLAELEGLGLTKADMLRLERMGFAVRAYLPTRAGFIKKYIILAQEENNDKTAVHGTSNDGTGEPSKVD